MSGKNGFAFDQHKELGEELYTLSQRLMYLGNKLYGTYDKRTANFAFDAHESILKLRSQMDTHVLRETEEDSRLYFGSRV